MDEEQNTVLPAGARVRGWPDGVGPGHFCVVGTVIDPEERRGATKDVVYIRDDGLNHWTLLLHRLIAGATK